MEENRKRKEPMNRKGFIVYVCRWSIETCKEWKELDRNSLFEWMSWSPSFKARADSRNFPGDIRKLTTHFLILRNTKTLLNLEYHQKQLWWHIERQFDMVGGFLRCNSVYLCIMNQNVRSAFWVGTNYDGMWHRNKKESIFQGLWCVNSGFVKELKTWPLHQNKHHVSLFWLQTCRTLNESVLNVSDLKALK